jgi:4-hydroxy-tetrahydrodipicolinate reductase
MTTKICIAGATGNVGRHLVKAVLDADDLELTAAVGKSNVGENLGRIVGDERTNIVVDSSVEVACEAKFDVFIDYTQPDVVRENVRTAIERGVHVVIGTSGLSDADYDEIEWLAKENLVGVLAAGNFSITAALMQYFATVAARFIPHWEILDYGTDIKPDAPSGTTRELAYKLSKVATPDWAVPVEENQGLRESRGATLNKSQVHSIRLPGFYSSSEVIFGLAGERLKLRHDSMSYQPYVDGTLLAVRKVQSFVGLKRGLETVLDF